MKPPRSVSTGVFWGGIAVGIAFRLFAYGLLYVAFQMPDVRGLAPSTELLLTAFSWLVALCGLAAPFWIPFAAGFVGAYFWGNLEVRQYVSVIWLSALGFLLTLFILSLALALESWACFLVLCVLLDVGMCGKGVDQGIVFWNGRLGRQFLGDFSTRDEDEEM